MSNTENPCRLYLVIAPDAGTQITDVVEQALDAGDVACVALRARADGTADRALAERLCALTQNRDTEFLIEADVSLAGSVGSDGVHIAGDESLYETARAALGEEAIIGVECPPERHVALSLAEKGADYIAITGDETDRGTREEFLRWWAEIVEVPVVAWGAESLDEVTALARAGSDFVAVEDALWNGKDGPANAVVAMNTALADQQSAA